MMANEVENEDELSKSSENQVGMNVDENVGGQGSEEIRHRHWVSQDSRDELDANGDEDDDDEEEILTSDSDWERLWRRIGSPRGPPRSRR